MERWDLIEPNNNLVLNDSIEGERVPVTEEEQALVPLIARTLMERSMRYYIVIEHNQGPRHIDQHYWATAWLIYEAAKRLHDSHGGRGYSSHTLKTWIAIIMGPDFEQELINAV